MTGWKPSHAAWDRAVKRIGRSGAGIDVIALASVRATREATVSRDGDTLPVIVGTPDRGEENRRETSTARERRRCFSGDLPANPDVYFDRDDSSDKTPPQVNIVRFRPPEIDETGAASNCPCRIIRLDRALSFSSETG